MTSQQGRSIQWHWTIVLFLIVVLSIPIRRYEMPFDLPFQLEPYRAVIVLLLLVWLASLLIDPRVRLRRTGLDGPMAAILATAALSVVFNPSSMSLLGGQVVKSIMVLLTFTLLFYYVANLTTSLRSVEIICRVLVAGGVILSILAAIESRTGWTPFDDLQRVIPFIRLNLDFELTRGANVRAMASAEQPIAFGALLVLILPLAVYLAFKYRRWWQWGAVLILALGAASSVSRSAVVMLLVMAIVYFILRPGELIRLSPLLVPFIVAVHFVVPGTLGTLKASFTGETLSNKGRTQDYSPAWSQVKANPIFGAGYGTRIVTGPGKNADVLDNQWLASLIETGVVGAAALLWLLLRFITRLGRVAKHTEGPEAWLAVGLTAAVSSWTVGMLLFDSFSFIQVALVLFVLLALGSSLALAPDPILVPTPQRRVAAVLAPVGVPSGTTSPPGRRAVPPVAPQL